MFFRRRLLAGLLLIGTIAGYAHGFHALRHHHRAHWEAHREQMMQSVAAHCVDAARHTR